MSNNAFTGEIALFGGILPANDIDWLPCDGRLLQISDTKYTGLYQMIGNAFGGDGKTTFALPDMIGRVPIGQGAGPGLTPRTLGQKGGDYGTVMTEDNLPPHTHVIVNVAGGDIMVSSQAGTASTPGIGVNTIAGTALANLGQANYAYNDDANPNVPWNTGTRKTAVTGTGTTSAEFPIMQNTTVVGYYICVNGMYPQFGEE